MRSTAAPSTTRARTPGASCTKSARRGCRARGSSSAISSRASTRFTAAAGPAARRSSANQVARLDRGGGRRADSRRRRLRATGGIDDKIVRLLVRDMSRHAAARARSQGDSRIQTARAQVPSGLAPARRRCAARDRRAGHGGRRSPRSCAKSCWRARSTPTSTAICSSSARIAYLDEAQAARRGALGDDGRLMRLNSLQSLQFPSAHRHPHRVRDGHHGHHRSERLRQVDDSRGDRVGAVRHARRARHARFRSLVPRRPRAPR